MSLLSKLFGGNEKSDPKPVTYKGFDIFPDLIVEGGRFRLSARIEKTIDGDRKVHAVIGCTQWIERLKCRPVFYSFGCRLRPDCGHSAQIIVKTQSSIKPAVASRFAIVSLPSDQPNLPNAIKSPSNV